MSSISYTKEHISNVRGIRIQVRKQNRRKSNPSLTINSRFHYSPSCYDYGPLTRQQSISASHERCCTPPPWQTGRLHLRLNCNPGKPQPRVGSVLTARPKASIHVCILVLEGKESRSSISTLWNRCKRFPALCRNIYSNIFIPFAPLKYIKNRWIHIAI